MKKVLYLLIFPYLFLVIQSCHSSEKNTLGNNLKTMKGYYIYGVEVSSFQPCGSKKVYWVVGTNEILADLTKKYEQLNTKLYGEVFAVFKGKNIGRAKDGFAQDYDGQVKVEKIIDLKRKSSKDCK